MPQFHSALYIGNVDRVMLIEFHVLHTLAGIIGFTVQKQANVPTLRNYSPSHISKHNFPNSLHMQARTCLPRMSFAPTISSLPPQCNHTTHTVNSCCCVETTHLCLCLHFRIKQMWRGCGLKDCPLFNRNSLGFSSQHGNSYIKLLLLLLLARATPWTGAS